MQVNPAIFKAYDIRGVYPTELNEDAAYLIGRAFASFLQVEKVIVGRDMRVSSPAIFDAVTRGLTDQGADVTDIGMVSTDQYYYACATLGLAGMMVTASHNPAQYSGFKMVRKMPYLLSGDEGIQDLRRLVESEEFATPTRKGEITTIDLNEEFVNYVLTLVDVKALQLHAAAAAPLRVIADTGNGMVGPALQAIYSRLPLEFEGMYLDPDGTLPNHGLDPLQPENRAELQARVLAEGFDIGFLFDGDGDRFFAVDDRGTFISGDFLTAIMGQYMLERYAGAKILYDVRASWAVPDLISAKGGTPLMERVGHAFIKQRMASEDAVFAGEVTGHYYFKDFFYADSGILPSLLLLELLARRNIKMSDLLKELEAKYFISGEINSKVADVKGCLATLATRYADAKVEYMDGVSVTYDTWHFNVRGSNTEPLIRLNLESVASPAEMEDKRDEVLAIIRG
ncbi:MAG: phosphomannomutase/phosphoglucomutase [Candidatus Viridilinea halotolerans]|uniref:Phosphomannomutase/phosphoglucomutase n=1 Tax=Candidatus Viridilinea halotolerans TaxID=2491704 RepID=A0A426U2M8_9CHLR|nr:MAG: phosphomannomutase/phosphoglucomutase [Candidatus Viridilinea halotolerans]